MLNPEKHISEEKKAIIDKLLGVEQHPRENLLKRNCKKCGYLLAFGGGAAPRLQLHIADKQAVKIAKT